MVSFTFFSRVQKCADHRSTVKDESQTFARTFPPATQVTESVLALFDYYRWRRFTIIAGSSGRWQSIADQVVSKAQDHGMEINGRYEFDEPYIPEHYIGALPDIVNSSYQHTRGTALRRNGLP